MGEEQKLSVDQQLASAREQLENGRDYTVAVEEEFALLDPDTLSLDNRFEELQALAAERDVGPHLVGELIASEAEVRTGRCESFNEAATKMGERREQLSSLADELGVLLGASGAHPWSPWQAQRIIDTPHYRRNDELLRYVVWRNNTFGQHVHVGIRGADRAVKVASAMRNFLPELLALSASSPFVEDVNSGLHSVRTQIFTRMFPRCGVPDTFADWREYEQFIRFLYRTGSIAEHTQLWWSVRVHLFFPTVEVRIADAQPDLGEGRSLAALAYSLVARCARALDEGEPLIWQPHRMIEENLWRAIRWGLSGEMIDLATGDVRPTRGAIEELIEWVMPVAEELGSAPFLAVPEQNSAERQIARYEEGAGLREIYAELVKGSERVGG
ncbi:MAG TPA: YbdK family carboxylate-amine ligase [Gaiellaceae bacterium]